MMLARLGPLAPTQASALCRSVHTLSGCASGALACSRTVGRSRGGVGNLPRASRDEVRTGQMMRRFGGYINPMTVCTLQPLKEHKSTVVFLHGLGDSGQGWYEPMDIVQEKHPHTKFVLPTAPRQPVTINRGAIQFSWFDIEGGADRTAESFTNLDKAQAAVIDFLQMEQENTGIPYDQMVLGGFSQGGAVAMFTGLQLKHRLAGVCALSTYLPYGGAFLDRISTENAKTPVYVGHGDDDEMVSVTYSVRTKDWLESKGLPVTYRTFPNLGHAIDDDGIVALSDWLSTVLPSE